ncbi:hypothetical protein OO012_18520 [Rhodobacteraceae bacterium KMM 6894]|nr:hypothetical protein [Rhodobacteraceae bacterium KMM 6894]
MIVVIAALAISAAIFHTKNPVTNAAGRYAASIAAASAVTYVTLRTLNAVLSTAQEVEVGASVGVSGTLQPGKMLEPVDDTIERIASAVFTLMLIAGVIAVAMGPIGAIGAGMITVACVIALIGGRTQAKGVAHRLGIYGAFLTIGLPLCLIGANMLAAPLTGPMLAENQAIVASIVSDNAPDASDALAVDVEDDRWFAGLRDSISSGSAYLEQAQMIMTEADTLIKSYLAILAVLIFRIFLLPVIFVAGVWLVMRTVARDG